MVHVNEAIYARWQDKRALFLAILYQSTTNSHERALFSAIVYQPSTNSHEKTKNSVSSRDASLEI